MKCITPVDAIINAVNPALLIGSEVDVAIHRKGLTLGEVVITTVGNLGVTYVIHTVGPVRNQGRKEKGWMNN